MASWLVSAFVETAIAAVRKLHLQTLEDELTRGLWAIQVACRLPVEAVVAVPERGLAQRDQTTSCAVIMAPSSPPWPSKPGWAPG